MGEPLDRLVWIDLEMTGLDPAKCTILEIATIITDSNLDIVAEGPCLIVHQADDALAAMNDFVRELHTRSGLLDLVTASTTSLEEAETQTLHFLEQQCVRGTAPLCGNSVWKDRQFLEQYMPRITSYLHYRTVDVSTIKELVRRWYPAVFQAPKKKE